MMPCSIKSVVVWSTAEEALQWHSSRARKYYNTIVSLWRNKSTNLCKALSELLSPISANMDMHTATTKEKALELLSTLIPKAVVVTDASITEPGFRTCLVVYVKCGGILVMGGFTMQFSKMDEFFSKVWNLPWSYKQGYDKADLILNPNNSSMKAYHSMLAPTFYTKSVYLAGVSLASRVYISTDKQRLGEALMAQTIAAFEKVGNGYLGYIGDVSFVPEIGQLMLAMCSVDEDDDDEDDDAFFDNCGFSGSQVNELLSFGIKPWEDDAWEALDSIYEDREESDRAEKRRRKN